MFENNEYVNYSFEPVETEKTNNLNAAPDPVIQSGNEKKRKKRGRGLKVVALALSCALLGGLGGGAVTAYYFLNRPTTTAAQNDNETVDRAESANEDNVIVNNVVHTNKGDKSLTPQEVYNMYVNSVVGITTSGTTKNIFGQISRFASSGSGFVISDDGYIITNHHVISDASAVKVALYDGTTYDAEIVGSDAGNDVALLKVEATGLSPVAIGNSDEIAVGDQVAAIGNPLGELTFTLTAGYVSALDREINTDGTPINMLQTDAAINSGNSGGPLFDMNGNVIGITTAKYSGSTSSGTVIEGIGFAIPINDAMSIVNDLRTHGYVTGQAYLGVSVKDLDATTASYYGLPLGVYVADVTDGSCAEEAGVQQGDIITAIGEYEVEEYADLASGLKQYKAGESTTLGIYRGGKTLTLNITLDEKMPGQAGSDTDGDAEAQTPENQLPDDDRDPGSYSESPFDRFFGG